MYRQTPTYSLNIGGKLLSLDKPLVMAIVNLTPDSFYASSRVAGTDALVERVEDCLSQGADIIDVGACSTRPGSEACGAKEEWARLGPALALLRQRWPKATLSLDTFRSEVARRAVQDYGVDIINDVSGGELDAEMFATVADCHVPYVLTHSPVRYGQSVGQADNSVEGVLRYLAAKLSELRMLGVAEVMVDPGFGFGKSLEENYALLRRLRDFEVLDAPLLVGLSRKRMAYEPLGDTPADALTATTVLHTLALQGGARILRVHDVKAAADCIKIMDLYQQ